MSDAAAGDGGATASDFAFDRSFVIVDQSSLAAIEADFAMGKLLYAINQYNTSVIPKWNADHPSEDPKKVHTDEEFAVHTFEAASPDTLANNESDAHVGTVWPIVDTFAERVASRFHPETDKVGPFRLLAVVNRMDVTGDMDLRAGGELAGLERRWFGEGRLVFGLREPYDSATPFPMTFIMEYRLPAIRRGPSGEIVADDAFDPARGPASMTEWIERRKLWASVWKDLSRHALGTPAYVDALRRVVALFTPGRNHIALRTGERVRAQATGAFSDELEYREFYLNGRWMLARRKLRREPFFCSQASLLGSRIDSEWDDTAKTLEWSYTLGERNLTDAEIAAATAGCGGKLPYGQYDEDRKGTQLRAKFSRFKVDTVWKPATTEERRHEFAIGACSGCHAAETSTQGFQIAPSLPGKNAILAPFLRGKTTATPNGTTYTYDEPERRMALSRQFLAGVDVPGDMLHSLDCYDVDLCKSRSK